MSIVVRPFHPLDVLRIEPSHFGQPDCSLSLEDGHRFSDAGGAISVLHHGRILLIGGVVNIWPGRSEVWSVLAKGSEKQMLMLTKIARNTLELSFVKRLESYCLSGFSQGERWLKILGFQHEATLKSYYPNGSDAELYVRIGE
jgi:hypothetical protein